MATANTPSASIIRRSYQCLRRRASRPSPTSSRSPSDAMRPPTRASQRDVVVLLPGVGELLVLQALQRPYDASPRPVRDDDVVEVAARGGHERVGEVVAVVVFALGQLLRIAD